MSERFNVADIFGENVFNDTIMKERLPKNVYKNLKLTMEGVQELSLADADVIANAMKEWKEALSMPDTIKPIYRERLWDFVFYPQITYEVESKYLGIYQRRKTVIKGIGLDMITGEEEKYIKSRQK